MKHSNKIFLLVVAAVVLIVLAALLDLTLRRNTQSSILATHQGAARSAKPVKKSASAKPAEQNKAVVFKCAGGKTIQATFHLPEDKSVSLALSDGRKLEVPHALSANGARYANSDESFVFWNVGDTAFIQEKGKTTFDDCVLTDTPARNK